MSATDPFKVKTTIDTGKGEKATIFSLPALAKAGFGSLERLPFSIRVMLENALRHVGHGFVTEEHVKMLASWTPDTAGKGEIPWMPARVILQDFTGVPCVVDLAAMRDAMVQLGGDPRRINPVVPCDLVIDHSVQVDYYGSAEAFDLNVAMEFKRNSERYQLLKFAQHAFKDFQVVPPGTGIVHQVNLEYLSPCVQVREQYSELTVYPDSLVGTDSHTTMINGLGVMGWGVGGIEAEAVMLGQPYFMIMPEVVGLKLSGKLAPGCTATDLVLTVTELLRKRGVVDKFVEYFGPGLASLPLADRATLGNMSPEYGATMGFFPVDAETIRYLRKTGRDESHVDLVERYCRAQGLFHEPSAPDPVYSEIVELDLATVTPSVAGPKRPQDRIALPGLEKSFALTLPGLMKPTVPSARRDAAQAALERWSGEGGAIANAPELQPYASFPCCIGDEEFQLHDGAVVIAAITSCTNTSNPSVMIGAGLVAKKALEKGLSRKPWVKSSLAPGSRVVSGYLDRSGLSAYLDQLGFQTVGYGCTTCIGNSGPLPEPVARTIDENSLVTAAVLSGNRNFEARIHPQVRANYLMSPMLVVAFALLGRVNVNLDTEPLGLGKDGKPVFLKDIWPTPHEINECIEAAVGTDLFRDRYAEVFHGDEQWRDLPVPEGDRFAWVESSTYVRNPPFFSNLAPNPSDLTDIHGARVLALLGDSVTTDHISPAGAIPKNSPAAEYLKSHEVDQLDWNTFGSRRGNHEVMMRGTFGNVRIKNRLTPEREGNWTLYHPSGEEISIYDAAMRYIADNTPLVLLVGKEYGTGSSRDWAAKGTTLLGVKAVIAESYERIHRSNLVGMGVLPLAFLPGENAESHGLTGHEVFDLTGIASGLEPGGIIKVKAVDPKSGKVTTFDARAKLNSEVEVEYLRHGGILPRVLRLFAESN